MVKIPDAIWWDYCRALSDEGYKTWGIKCFLTSSHFSGGYSIKKPCWINLPGPNRLCVAVEYVSCYSPHLIPHVQIWPSWIGAQDPACLEWHSCLCLVVCKLKQSGWVWLWSVATKLLKWAAHHPPVKVWHLVPSWKLFPKNNKKLF